MKQNAISIVRWIGVLPAACVAYVLAYFLLMLINWISVKFYISSDGDGGWMNIYVFPIIASGAAGFYFVILGSLVAPLYHKQVRLVLLILICLVSGFILFSLLYFKDNYIMIFHSISQIVGAVIAYNQDDES